MLIVVDPSSGVPVYRQLMDQIKFHIASGLLGPGDELPSTRTLSSELGVNPMTISKAYSFLEREGVLERRPGRPLVVRAVESEQIRAQKIEQLRQSLISSATMAKQFGIAPASALKLFEEMLDETGEDSVDEGTGTDKGDSENTNPEVE
jgi:GntR family transcriptional regulator